MIRIIILVAVMVAGLIFGPQASGNKGYVLIALGNYTIESLSLIHISEPTRQ